MNPSSQSMSEDASKFSEREQKYEYFVSTGDEKPKIFWNYVCIRLSLYMTILTPARLGKLQQDVNFDINSDLSQKMVVSFRSCILVSLCLGQKISVWRCFLVKLLSYLWNVFFFCWFCVPTSLPLYDCRLPSVRNWYFSPSIKTILNLCLASRCFDSEYFGE